MQTPKGLSQINSFLIAERIEQCSVEKVFKKIRQPPNLIIFDNGQNSNLFLQSHHKFTLL